MFHTRFDLVFHLKLKKKKKKKAVYTYQFHKPYTGAGAHVTTRESL